MPANAILQVLANQHGFDPASGSLASHLVNLFKGAASNHSKRLFGGHVSSIPVPGTHPLSLKPAPCCARMLANTRVEAEFSVLPCAGL